MKRSIPPSVYRLRDLLGGASAVLLAKPGRAALTSLGTMLGVSAFIAVLGLTATTSGQISKQFTALQATEVSVEEVTAADDPTAFPVDADSRVRRIDGVQDAGVWWPLGSGGRAPSVSGILLPGQQADREVAVFAASPGLLRAVRPTITRGRLFDESLDNRTERVAVLGAGAAQRLGVMAVEQRPAIFVAGMPFTVIGILDDVERRPELLSAVLLPRRSVEKFWGGPNTDRAKLLVDTRLGAAGVVAEQVAVALRPDAPTAFKVFSPPNPWSLHEQVDTDLNVLFLLLAGVCLVIGAVGIANTTMVAVLERVGEIGLRRALGARPRHITAQFLAESAVLGLVGGITGTSLGVTTVVIVAWLREWTPILPTWAVLPAPLIGALIGVLAGIYPAIKAARIEPASALRR